MTPEQHFAKGERITHAMSKLTTSDYEMVIEAAMLAGGHWLNGALHRCGMTRRDEDVMHVEYLPLAISTKMSLIAPGLAELLDEIEQFRPIYVRGNAGGGETAAKRCIELLKRLRNIARTTRRVDGIETYAISSRGVAHARD